MSREFSIIFIGILSVLTIIILFLLNFLLRKKNKKQLDRVFIVIFILFLIALLPTIFQTLNLDTVSEPDLIYYDFVSYVGVCYLPVAFLIMALVFSNTKVNFSNKFKLLLIIPTLSILMLWTNNFHHLFYKYYSIYTTNVKFGNYFYIYYPYTMILFGISAIILLRYSIKNSGFFSKQAILISAGIAVPIVSNILSSVGIIPGINVTPIALTVTIILFSFAMFKFDLFKITPIALQTIVDRISDSYVILNEDYEITDFNQTFVNTFGIEKTSNLRGTHFAKFLEDINLKNEIETFAKYLEKVDKDVNVNDFELKINKLNKNFNVEISPIIVGNQLLGILVLFKDITEHVKDMQSLKNNQELLIEQERLASLGQMIGGIAHNLKTPIFSVTGGLEGLSDLITEFDESIDDPTVNSQDMHDIAKDMRNWIVKLKDHVTYMSDVITTVKGQAVSMSEEQNFDFPISELFQHVSILMQHILKQQLATLEIENNVPDNVKINGNINSLVQVVNNLISNSIEAYKDQEDKPVELTANYDNSQIIISVKDHGPGLPDKVKDKLFKEMITTKGKNGTGLGLFMSYSNIKAHFNGNITYKTGSNGTTFDIIIPHK